MARSPAESGGVYVESGRTYLYEARDPRLLVGPTHSAYLKIAEGCDRICAFCAIPGIRGRFQSRSLESLEGGGPTARGGRRSRAEPRRAGFDLVGQGPSGSATTRRGAPPLDDVEGLDWIRLLYCTRAR